LISAHAYYETDTMFIFWKYNENPILENNYLFPSIRLFIIFQHSFFLYFMPS